MQQLLREPDIEPTDKVIVKGLGKTNKAYAKFIQELKQYDITLMDWRYYNDGRAWLTKGEYKWVSPRGANKVKPIFWLSIWEGFFKITFFFSTSIQPELLDLPISKGAKEIIRTAKPMGKTMRFISVIFDIKTDKQLSDVYTLAQFRKNL